MQFTLDSDGNGYLLHLTPSDTEAWASKPGAAWPCSKLAGFCVSVVVNQNGLASFAVENGYERISHDADTGDGSELEAIIADHLPPQARRFWPVWEKEDSEAEEACESWLRCTHCHCLDKPKFLGYSPVDEDKALFSCPTCGFDWSEVIHYELARPGP